MIDYGWDVYSLAEAFDDLEPGKRILRLDCSGGMGAASRRGRGRRSTAVHPAPGVAITWVTLSLTTNCDGFPSQELIDKIIDNLPRSNLCSCSLIVRRWQRRTQGRVFSFVTFASERDLVLWRTKIPQDLGGITSYVRITHLVDIFSWRQPALFGRVLKKLTSLTMLWIDHTRIPRPHQLPDSTSLGDFGKTVECLTLSSPQSTVATIASLALSFPNLKVFCLSGRVSKGRCRPPTCITEKNTGVVGVVWG